MLKPINFNNKALINKTDNLNKWEAVQICLKSKDPAIKIV